MAIDFEALKAKLAAQKAALNKESEHVGGNSNGIVGNVDSPGTELIASSSPELSTTQVQVATTIPTISAPARIGTAVTSEIDHLDFLGKMNRLAQAIHTKHPTMPVLLMQIHKQLRADPELVTTLDEDAIGMIVSGLQVVTKTELVSVVVKESKSKSKKIALTSDMF